MKCLYCGKALALAEKLKFHDFCSANHQKAYATERDWAEFQNRLHPRGDDDLPVVQMAGLEPWHPTVNSREGELSTVGHGPAPALMPIDSIIPRLALPAKNGQAAPMQAAAPLPAVRVAATRVRLRFAEMGLSDRYYPALERVDAPEEAWLVPMASTVDCGPSAQNVAGAIQTGALEKLLPASRLVLPMSGAEQPKTLTIEPRLRMLPLSIRLRRTPGSPLFVQSEGTAKHS